MKSTKNILITGIALAIALFTSVQVTAMNVQNQINNLQARINDSKLLIKEYEETIDPKTSQYYQHVSLQEKQRIQKDIESEKNNLKKLEAQIQQLKNKQ